MVSFSYIGREISNLVVIIYWTFSQIFYDRAQGHFQCAIAMQKLHADNILLFRNKYLYNKKFGHKAAVLPRVMMQMH